MKWIVWTVLIVLLTFALYQLLFPTIKLPKTSKTNASDIHKLQNTRMQREYDSYKEAGASKEMLELLRAIADKRTVTPALIKAAGDQALKKVFETVQTAMGQGSTVLTFALRAKNYNAMPALFEAGADASVGTGMFPRVAASFNASKNPFEPDWSLSIAALELYSRNGGDIDFPSKDSTQPLFTHSLSNGNLQGALFLLERGADIWVRYRNRGNQYAAVQIRRYDELDVKTFIRAAELGQFKNAPKDGIDNLVQFYAEGYLDDSLDKPDPSFGKFDPELPRLVEDLFAAILENSNYQAPPLMKRVLSFHKEQP